MNDINLRWYFLAINAKRKTRSLMLWNRVSLADWSAVLG